MDEDAMKMVVYLSIIGLIAVIFFMGWTAYHLILGAWEYLT